VIFKTLIPCCSQYVPAFPPLSDNALKDESANQSMDIFLFFFRKQIENKSELQKNESGQKVMPKKCINDIILRYKRKNPQIPRLLSHFPSFFRVLGISQS
jgi:hypothetical protein